MDEESLGSWIICLLPVAGAKTFRGSCGCYGNSSPDPQDKTVIQIKKLPEIRCKAAFCAEKKVSSCYGNCQSSSAEKTVLGELTKNLKASSV